jgi:site-specific DNA recombinase
MGYAAVVTLRLPTDVKIEADVLSELMALAQVDGPPCLIYARMSRDRTGAFLGIDRQLRDDFSVIRSNGLRVVGVFADNDMSAYSGKPLKDQLAMLDFLEAAPVSAVITWHTDRLYRIPTELEKYITICDPRGITTNTFSAGPLDLSTPSGRMAARVHCAVARYEVEHAIERRKSANRQKAEAGLPVSGKRPFGYEADAIRIREREASVLKDVGRRVLAGESCNSLANELNARGITTSTGGRWTNSTLRDVLLRPRNAGLSVLHGEVVGPAAWQGIWTEDERYEWEALRALLLDPARGVGRTRSRTWLGTGLYLCGKHDDGTTVTSGRQRGRPAYKCRETEHLKRYALPVDDIVERAVVAYLEDPRNWPRLQPQDPGGELAEMRREVSALQVRIAELDDELDDGVITKDRWVRRNQRLTARLSELNEKLILASAGSALHGVLGPDLRTRWYGTREDRADGFSLERRAAVIQAVCTVTVLPGTKFERVVDPSSLVRIVWHEPY